MAAYNDAEAQPDGTERFSSYLSEHFISDAAGGIETVAIDGRAKRKDDGSIQIVLDVDAKEPIRFAVENLVDVKISRDGRPIDKSQSQSGLFQVTINGRFKAKI